MYFLKWIITKLLKNQHNLLQPFYASSHDVFVIGVLVLAIGAGIGVARLDDRPPPLPRGVTPDAQFWIESTRFARRRRARRPSRAGSVNGTSTSFEKPTAT